MIGHVNKVDYAYGATVLQTNGQWGAITLGSYIIGDENIKADAKNVLFQHEYGHYLQSQYAGWGYFLKYAIPSMISSTTNTYYDHGYHPVEQDANVRAFSYFMKNVKGFTVRDWEFNRKIGGHPIKEYNVDLPFYYDTNQEALKNGLMLIASLRMPYLYGIIY